MNKDTDKIVREFIETFEQVFHKDWKYTQSMLGIPSKPKVLDNDLKKLGLEDIPVISTDGTFIDPKVDDEIEDWGYRGKLLHLYRKLKVLGY